MVIASNQKRQFIVDSGASFHLASKNVLTKAERKTVRPMKEPLLMRTANGVVVAKEEADIYVEAFDTKLTAVLIADTPPLISLGKLCLQDGFTFIWKPGKTPYIQKGNGPRRMCSVT